MAPIFNHKKVYLRRRSLRLQTWLMYASIPISIGLGVWMIYNRSPQSIGYLTAINESLGSVSSRILYNYQKLKTVFGSQRKVQPIISESQNQQKKQTTRNN